MKKKTYENCIELYFSAQFFFTFTFKCFDENLSHLSFDGDFRSILNLCTLCYRALYRRLLCKTSDAFESSKNKTKKKLRNKTQYNKMNEKYIILLYFGAAKLLFSRFVLQKFVLFSFLFWLYFSSFI